MLKYHLHVFIWTPINIYQHKTGVFRCNRGIRHQNIQYNALISGEKAKKTIISKLSAMEVFATHPQPTCMLLAYKKTIDNYGRSLMDVLNLFQT